MAGAEAISLNDAKRKETPNEKKAANSNLAVRVATAAVGAPLIVALLYKGPPWGFFLLVFAATLIG